MAHVNLLPWRAERRKLREREFYGQLGAAFVAGLGFVLLWALWMGARIDNQNDRNTILQGEIKQLDVKIDKIKELDKVRDHLLARKQIIEQLQADRSKMVHLFDELVKTIPNSVRLTALKQAGDTMSLDGVAQSNANVAEYMRNIEVSPWMGHVDLRSTVNTHDSSRTPYSFGLSVGLGKPKVDDASSPAGASSVAEPAHAGSAAALAPVSTPAMPKPPVAKTQAERAQVEVEVKALDAGSKNPNNSPAERARLSAMARALEDAQTLPNPGTITGGNK
ncbi:PilN domain-containing protein [Rhodanobacter sp. 7MK24]|uniref:PilN domain-containing protein n=1 Tax=Rhodanobacter sp. 7MK24 TaxID=2775922 RepID=UPI001785E353|nr:PilN domain-containing protein [Rhodanobacter sp. 7MK24]MBD8881107.1 PilN domain-containing protein [Rhodanobacter sp. 7MK24]